MNYINKISEINTYIYKHLTKKRYTHSLEVAKMSETISKLINVDSHKAYLSGLSHDIAREENKDFLINNIEKNKYSLEFYNNINLYHGPVGSKILIDRFGINDLEILESVEYHSIGYYNMCTLSKIVYISDYISLDRKHIEENFREKLFKLTLNNMILTIIEHSKLYLNTKNCKLMPETILLYETLKKEKNEKET